MKFKLEINGGMLGDNQNYRDMVFDSKEKAQEKANSIRRSYSPAQRKYYGLKIKVRPERKYEEKERIEGEKR